MNKISYILTIVGILLCMSAITCCKEEVDGKGPTMRWTLTETDENWKFGRDFNIPADGGSYTFKCNIEFNICSIEYFDGESSKYIDPIPNEIEIPEFVSISTSNDKRLAIRFYGNSGVIEKDLRIETHNGNSFSTFKFVQKPKD